MILKINKILLLFVVVILSILLYFSLLEPMLVRPQSNITENNKTIEIISSENGSNRSSDNSVLVPENVCEGCHLSGKSSIPQATKIAIHMNAGAYCMVCHNFSHQTHPMASKNVTCEKCHGVESPTKPIFTNGTIVCNNCHNYPDPLKPSYGNILTIHRSRNISCITCHTSTCTKCHAQIGTNDQWTKRLVHFRTILDNPNIGINQ
jgi:hypothetical protein